MPGSNDWCAFHYNNGEDTMLPTTINTPESKYSTKALAEAVMSLQLPQPEKEQLALELSEAIVERDKAFNPKEFTDIIRGVVKA